MACAAAATLALAGCGGDDEQAEGDQVRTVTETVREPAPAPDGAATTPEDDDSAGRPRADRVGRSPAIAIARERVGGGRVEEAERDEDDGRAVWEVELRRGNIEYDVTVAVRGGKVLDVDSDRDDDD